MRSRRRCRFLKKTASEDEKELVEKEKMRAMQKRKVGNLAGRQTREEEQQQEEATVKGEQQGG